MAESCHLSVKIILNVILMSYDKQNLVFMLLYYWIYETRRGIRPVARQGSLPETRFYFLKHFRILYPFIPNTIQSNQRLCDNWHCKDLTQKNSKSVTLILMSCTGIGMVLHKILDKALSSRHNWIKSTEGFAKKNWNCKTSITKLLYENSESVTFWVGNGTI